MGRIKRVTEFTIDIREMRAVCILDFIHTAAFPNGKSADHYPVRPCQPSRTDLR